MPQHLSLAAALLFVSLWSYACLAAEEYPSECWSPAACGKVCKLVCEPKKLAAICYACECHEICIPGASRPGCKHCSTCQGESSCEPCSDCNHTPECEFCWRDWFACGCARPRTVKVLTKYEGEKEIGWYHWEVVDAACCDCVSLDGKKSKDGIIYKPAPAEAELGDVLAVSKDEWEQLSAQLTPAENPRADSVQVAAQPTAEPTAPVAEPKEVSVAERIQGLFRK